MKIKCDCCGSWKPVAEIEILICTQKEFDGASCANCAKELRGKSFNEQIESIANRILLEATQDDKCWLKDNSISLDGRYMGDVIKDLDALAESLITYDKYGAKEYNQLSDPDFMAKVIELVDASIDKLLLASRPSDHGDEPENIRYTPYDVYSERELL